MAVDATILAEDKESVMDKGTERIGGLMGRAGRGRRRGGAVATGEVREGSVKKKKR